LDKIGLINKIFTSVNSIDLGRKGLDTDGEEHDGRLNYEDGIFSAMTAFQEAQKTADCGLLILTEETFLRQELHYCDTNDAITLSSLTQAVQSFGDAQRSLDVVNRPSTYQEAEKTHPTTKFRKHGLPQDAFHQACDAHRTRLSNSLRTPGVNMKEKAVIQQRVANMKTAVSAYIEKQRAALK
jgi:hypothetical protein